MKNKMDDFRLKLLIKQYEEVYLFVTKGMEATISKKLVPMSIEQFGILRQLALNGVMRTSEIAKATGVHKSAVTQKADRLVEKGLIVRDRDSTDRRQVFLNITDEGKAMYKAAEKEMITLVRSYVEELNPEEFEVYLKVSEQINHIIQRRMEQDKNE